MTWEITDSEKTQRDELTRFIGCGVVSWERLDVHTYDVTVPDTADDTVVEWAEQNGLGCRLI